MSGYGGNHHEKLVLKRISCASKFPILKKAGTSRDAPCNYPVSTSSQPNQASYTSVYAYRLVSSTSFSSSSPIILFLVLPSTIMTQHNVKLSFSISPCQDHELAPGTACSKHSIHQVQHTPSTAYTEYCIHRVQHTSSTASTEYSIH
jgi:hypothetical protein